MIIMKYKRFFFLDYVQFDFVLPNRKYLPLLGGLTIMDRFLLTYYFLFNY